MLDIGFSELLVIGGVALVVLGPEKLAIVARSAGKWTGKAQRYVNDVKADIAREGELAELRKLKEEMETTGRDIGSSLRTTAADVQHDLSALETTVKADVDTVSSTDSAASAVTSLSDAQAQATIQASLDGIGSSYSPPSIDMTGKYQSGLDATLSSPYAAPLSTPPLNDPIALRMEYEALQDDVARLETRMTLLKQDLAAGLESKPA